jgi:Ca2+:H+ antiporter
VTLLIAVMSEILVGALEPAAHRLGMTQLFVGLILVALVGNAAEHSTAVMVALKNKMDLALGIAVGSSLQIALLIAPILVFASYAFGAPLDLIFTPFEVAAVTISVLIVGFVAMDGESHWMEGVMLVGVYLMLAIAFFFLPA